MLVPVVGLVQVGLQAMADRYTYLPQIGLAVALVWGAADLCRSGAYRRRLGAAVSALVLAVLMGCAWRQTTFWRDSETLWTHALACTPENVPAHNNLGNALSDQGRLDEAITQYQQALEIKPDDAGAHNNLGAVLVSRGRFDEAMNHYRKVLEIDPHFAKVYKNIGFILRTTAGFRRRSSSIARPWISSRTSPRRTPTLASPWPARAASTRPTVQYRQALEIQPRYPEAYNNLGLALQARKSGRGHPMLSAGAGD